MRIFFREMTVLWTLLPAMAFIIISCLRKCSGRFTDAGPRDLRKAKEEGTIKQ